MKKLLVVAILFSLNSFAAEVPAEGFTAVCSQTGDGLFYRTLTLTELENETHWEAIYKAEYQELSGPRLVGKKYGVQAQVKYIVMRTKTGYSLKATVEDGSILNIEKSNGWDGEKFVGSLVSPDGVVTLLNCK